MPYPLESITPETPDPDKEAAVVATIEQMVSEGMSQEEAQAAAMQMLQGIMQMPSFPQGGDSTNYGESMKPPANNFMRERGTGSPRSIAPFRSIPNDKLNNFKHGFNSDGRISNK